MRFLVNYSAWICFLIATVNTIAEAIKFANGPMDGQHALFILLVIPILYTLWWETIRVKR